MAIITYITLIAFAMIMGCKADVWVGYSVNANYRVASANVDASSQLQQAISDVYAGTVVGPVLVEQGVYLISTNIIMASDVELKGIGASQSILKLVNNASSWWTDNSTVSGMIRIVDSSNVRISLLTLDGNKMKQNNSDIAHVYGKYGIYVQNSQGVNVYNATVQNFQGYGVALSQQTDTTISDVTFDSCIISHNNWDGIYIDNYANVAIRTSEMDMNMRHAVNVANGSQNIEILYNTMQNNGLYFPETIGGCGINVDTNMNVDAPFIYVNNNTMTNNFYAGFCMSNTPNTNMSFNTISNSNYCLVLNSDMFSNFTYNDCLNITMASNLVDDATTNDPSNMFAGNVFNSSTNLTAQYNSTFPVPTFAYVPPDTIPVELSPASPPTPDTTTYPQYQIPPFSSSSPLNVKTGNSAESVGSSMLIVLGFVIMMM